MSKHDKAKIKARNKRHHHINLMAEHQEEEARRIAGQAAQLAELPPTPAATGDPVWSARLQEIRNKNTGRKRMASERWNRFAGTSGGGGRGL